MLLDFIIYGSFIVLFLFSFAMNIFLYIKRARLQDLYIKTMLEKYTLGKTLEKARLENDSKKLEKDNGFIKFISESRDWAFNYIEEVQDAIKNYSVKKDDESYNKLINFLPKEDEKR